MRIAPLIAAVMLVGAAAGTWLWINDTFAVQQEPGRPGAGPKGGSPGAKGKRWGMGDGPVPVTVVPVATADVPVHREGIGNAQALAMVTVRSQVDGKLLTVEFTEGQDVKKGDVLARVDPATYQAQLDQMIARKAQNEALLANARLDLERAERLMTTGAGNRKTEDTSRAQVRNLEAQVKADQAAIDNARVVLGWTTIVSPIDGRAGLRLVDAGNLLRGDSSPIVSIMQVTPIAVVFTLPQRDLGQVNQALARGKVPVEILSADGKSVVASGELATIDNQIDQATGTIKLKAHFANGERRLWPGQFVSVRVVVDTLVGARVVPTAAIRRGPPGTFVYVIDGERRARVVPVKLGLESETLAVLAEGPEPGTQVVTVGFARLTDGRTVDVVVPGAAPKDGERRRRRDGVPGDKGGGDKGGAGAPEAGAAPASRTGAPPEGGERRGGGRPGSGGGGTGDRAGGEERSGREGGGRERGGEGRRRREAAGGTETGAGAAAPGVPPLPAAAAPAKGATQ